MSPPHTRALACWPAEWGVVRGPRHSRFTSISHRGNTDDIHVVRDPPDFAERVESWVESVVARRREQRRRGKAVLARGHDTGSSSSSSGINIEGSGPSGWSGRSGDDSMMSVGRSSNLERSGSHAGWAQRGKENRPRSSDAAGQAELEQEMDLLRFEGGQDGAETSWAEVEGHGSLRKRPRGDQVCVPDPLGLLRKLLSSIILRC